MLKAVGQTSWAMNLAASVGPDWTNWTRDPNALANVRFQLGQALDQAYGGAVSTPPPPVTTNFAPGVVSVSPVNSGNSITFTYTVSDANGAGDLGRNASAAQFCRAVPGV